MQSLRIFHLLIVITLCCSSFTLCGATRTLDEINEEQKKKEEEEKKAAIEAKKAEKAKKAADEKRKAEEKAKKKAEAEKNAAENPNPAVYQQTQAQDIARTYTLAEDVIGIPKPFMMTQIDNAALMNADQKAVELFEAATKKEKTKDVLKKPSEVIKLWKELAEITQNNPFAEIAKARFYEWHSVIALLNKHQENLDKVSKLMPTNVIPDEQKVSLVLHHLDEFGIMFGTDEILSIAKKAGQMIIIAKNEAFKAKIKEILIARCEKNSGKDCFNNAKYFAANDDEKITCFSKACELKYQAGCDEVKKVNAAAEAEKARIAAEEKRRIENEKRKAEEEARRIQEEKDRKIKIELNHAGRKKRLAIATSTFVSGVVVTILGGVSLKAMNKAGKDHDKYYQEYLEAKSNYEAEDYRKKAQNADKKHKTYMGLGIAGIGVGVALIATGITFYSIEFDGEKEVKKKYNLSFGASPMDGTLQLALRW